MNLQDTIVAPATGNIVSALGIIRLSGKEAVKILSRVFRLSGEKNFLDAVKPNTLYYGTIVDIDNGTSEREKIIDEVVVGVFLSPHSFTGEDIAEITFHGSPFIQQEIIKNLIKNGARLADKGEFSLRAFLNGKINLSQAEAVADLIQSGNQSSHDIAINQLRGGYNQSLKQLRQRFLKIASLLELEIDFSAEQEVFVDRRELEEELNKTLSMLNKLTDSFKQGNAFKNGIPVAIVGKPNSGKSTFMNTVLNDQRSIVSSIEGTTRDTVEETISINGINIRFIDTAGIRKSTDEIEKEGIKRSIQAVEKSEIILYLVDAEKETLKTINPQLEYLKQNVNTDGKRLIIVVNKNDISKLTAKDRDLLTTMGAVFISAKEKDGIDNVMNLITKDYTVNSINDSVFVSNIRHYNALTKASEETLLALNTLSEGNSPDLISENIRHATEYIGQITGEITNEDILGSIFSEFCIGK